MGQHSTSWGEAEGWHQVRTGAAMQRRRRAQVCKLPAGVPIKVVSERIGHADPAVTMQVYAHALEGDATAAETTTAAIFGD